MIHKGILRYVDLGAGGWQLECANGTVFVLYGDIPDNLKDKHVVVTAKKTEGFGFMMSSQQALEVISIQAK